MVKYGNNYTPTCRNDIQIAIKPFDSRESEFPPTTQNVELIVLSTINQ